MVMQAPKPVYYLLVTGITQLILALGAVVVLLATGVARGLPWSMIGFLFLYNVLTATLIGTMLCSRCEDNKRAAVRGGGLVLGHLVGILLGAVIGLRYGGLGWALAGGALMYFVTGWMGSQISQAVASYLDRSAQPSRPRDLAEALRRARPNTSGVFLYGAVIPALLMAAAIFIRSAGLPLAQHPALLPVTRLVLVALSLMSVLVPWLRQRGLISHSPRRVSHGTALRAIGLALSLTPALYGFLLFVAFGTSMAELSLFAVTASVAASTWALSKARL